MRLIGCDLHASQQSIAMLDRDTGEIVEQTLAHEGGTVREFYASIPRPVVVGIEATGAMGWLLRLMEALAIECRVGHPTAIRKAETRRQTHDRRDAALLLQLLAEDRFPAIWMPSTEYRDLRSLLLHRHQWVRIRTRVPNALHAIVLAHGVRRGHTWWHRDGQARLASVPLPPHTADRRRELHALDQHWQGHIDRLDDRVEPVANERARATLLMTQPGVGPVTALATEVFVGDPARFLDGTALSSDVGMIAREYSSGKRQRWGALSKQGNPFLRFLWCEAAAHAVRRDPDVQRFYRRKAVQKGCANARVAAARKLGIRLWIMWRDQIDDAECCRRGLARQSEGRCPCGNCPCRLWSSFAGDRSIDWATRLPHVEGVRTSHHGPP
jgi:transposase